MIIIHNLSKSYNIPVLQNFSIEIDDGLKVLIQGDSGAGKTTLFRCIADLENYKGKILVDGPLFFVFQENRFMPWLTIKENLLLPCKLSNKSIFAASQRMETICNDFDVIDHLHKYPESVSGGQLQRLSIAQGLIYQPNILLLDEPFKGMEEALYIKLYQYILNYTTKQEMTLLYISHDKANKKDFDKTVQIKNIYINE